MPPLAFTTSRYIQCQPRRVRGASALAYQAAGRSSPNYNRRHLVARRDKAYKAHTLVNDTVYSAGLSTLQKVCSQSPQLSDYNLPQAPVHWVDRTKTPAEVMQRIRQEFRYLGSSLEQQPSDVLIPLLVILLRSDGHKEVTAMVIDALLVSRPDDIQLIWARAELERTYNPQKALQTFSKYFQLGGRDASAYESYGSILLQQNDAQAVTAALSHAVAICEPSEKFSMLVARASCKYESGDQQGALNDLSEAGHLDQLGAGSLTELAKLHATFQDVAAAIAVMDRAALLEPLDADTTAIRAAWKYETGDCAGAKADLDTVILLGLDTSTTYRSRGVANMQLGHCAAAVADFDQAVAKESDQKEQYKLLVYRAACKRSMGNLQDAVAVLHAAEQIQPLSHDEKARHQQCLEQLAKSSPAAEQTTGASEQTTAEDPSTANALCRVAYMLMHMFQYREALQALQTLRAIDSSWNAMSVLKMCIACNNTLGQHEEALADLEQALAIDPRDPQLLQERGVTKATLGDYEGGLADINTSLQIRPDHPSALTARGTMLCKMHQPEAGLADLDKANDLRPHHAHTLMSRGFVKDSQGDWAGAIADFDEAEKHGPLNECDLQLRDAVKEKLRSARQL